jgi:hypothetical protein
MSRNAGATPGRRDPALERALPSDAATGTFRSVSPPVLARTLLRDGTWGQVEVHGWRRDTQGQWVALIRWYTPGAMQEAWFIHDPQCLHPDDR